MSRIINRDLTWINEDRSRFFEGYIMLPLVETILGFVPLHVECGFAALHCSGILDCPCFVFQL